MRVLWFTNMPMPAMDEFVGRETCGTGHWMTQLLPALQATGQVELGVATTWREAKHANFQKDGVNYYLIGYKGNPISRRLAGRRGDVDLPQCIKVIQDFKPDLINIHGTERPWGLLASRRLTSCPIVINMQGVMESVAASYFGSLSNAEILRSVTLREILRGSSIIHGQMRAAKAARRESEMIKSVSAFMGQTDYDKFHVLSINPQADYYRVWRILRQPFYEARWNLAGCRRHTIIFTNARSPLRDTESLVKAVGYLRHDFPDIKLKIAGDVPPVSGYGSFVRRQVAKLQGAVELLGWVDARRLTEELRSSHVFAIASHVENESNALCEAMLMGMPCVSSYAGGLPTTLEEGRGGLFFPMGDAAVLAGKIKSIFENDELAVTLGAAARQIALPRHDPKAIVQDLLNAYKAVLNKTAGVKPAQCL